MNSKKTEVMVTSKRPTAEGNIFIDETKEKKQSLKYSGTAIIPHSQQSLENKFKNFTSKIVIKKNNSPLRSVILKKPTAISINKQNKLCLWQGDKKPFSLL